MQQNSLALQQKLAERQKLLSQLDQAKMQEQLNRAMTSLNQEVGHDAPSLDQVRAKIEARYAKALGTSEVSGQTVEARMLEVQQATIGAEARSRLDSMREEMGLPSGGGGGALGGGATGELGSGSPVSDATGTPGTEPVSRTSRRHRLGAGSPPPPTGRPAGPGDPPIGARTPPARAGCNSSSRRNRPFRCHRPWGRGSSSW